MSPGHPGNPVPLDQRSGNVTKRCEAAWLAAAAFSSSGLHHVGQTPSQLNLDKHAAIRKFSRVQASVQLRGKGSPKNKNNIKMGRGGQEVLKMDDILACKALPLGKSQLQRQAMVREYVVKLAMILLEHISNHGFCVVDNFLGGQAGSLLLEEISAPNPGQG